MRCACSVFLLVNLSGGEDDWGLPNGWRGEWDGSMEARKLFVCHAAKNVFARDLFPKML